MHSLPHFTYNTIVMRLFRKKKEHSLSDILKGLQHAVDDMQEMLQARQMQNLQKFWHEADGTPVCRKIRIGDKAIDVPLATLVSHDLLEMDNIEVRFKARISSVDTRQATGSKDSTDRPGYAELHMEMDSMKVSGSDLLDITVRFKPKDVPEGIARLTDIYNKHIQ